MKCRQHGSGLRSRTAQYHHAGARLQYDQRPMVSVTVPHSVRPQSERPSQDTEEKCENERETQTSRRCGESRRRSHDRSRSESVMRIRSAVIAVAAANMLAAARRPASAQSESELAKASQNPIANLTSLPVQFNYYMGGGLASRTSLIVNVQPVLPLKLNDRWLLISRTVVPYVNLPMIDGTRRTGIADIQQQFYFTQKKSGMFVWGAGPIFPSPRRRTMSHARDSGHWARRLWA